MPLLGVLGCAHHAALRADRDPQRHDRTGLLRLGHGLLLDGQAVHALVAGGVRRGPRLRVLSLCRGGGDRAPLLGIQRGPAADHPRHPPVRQHRRPVTVAVRRCARRVLPRAVLHLDRGVRLPRRHVVHCARRGRPAARPAARRGPRPGWRRWRRWRWSSPSSAWGTGRGWRWRARDHIHGPAQPAVAIAGISSDPAGLVVPTQNQHFTFNEATLGDSYVAQRDANWHIVIDATLENGTYVGVPLLILLIAGVVLLRRNRFAVFTALMAAAAMVLSMGSYLHVDGHRTVIRLPFIVLAHLPLLSSGSAARYVLFFWLFAALLLALTLDRLLRDPRADRTASGRLPCASPSRSSRWCRWCRPGRTRPARRRCRRSSRAPHAHSRSAPPWSCSPAPTPATPPPCSGRPCPT